MPIHSGMKYDVAGRVVRRGDSAADRFMRAAAMAGCPADQVRSFLAAGYVAQPKQLAFHAAARLCDREGGPDQIGFGGARGPGKSHAVFAQVALDDCRRWPGLKALYLRKALKQAREQFDDLRRRVLRDAPNDFNRSAGVVTLWDDSRIFLGHFHNESDVGAYLGLEYDVIAIEEATTLSAVKYKALRDSNRSSSAWRPRIYATTNPGGVGHAWFKARFIDPWRQGNERTTRFVPATVDDNRFLDAGYRRRLEENTGWKLRAYRFGDWDIAAGQFFTNWRHEVHVVAPFQIPPSWTVWMALDYGFTHPTVAYLLARDGDGTIFVLDEHRQSKWLVQRHAAALRELLARNRMEVGRLATIVAGADVFARRGNSESTIAEQYADEGFSLSTANDDRVNGAAQVLKLLGDERQPAKLFVFDRCGYLVECLPNLEHDPARPEDVLKVDIDEDGNGGDDPYDALRYGVMAQPAGSFVMRYA
jgi:phage terminase large subunit